MQVENQRDTRNGLPWIQKYRPQSMEDLVAHSEIRQTLKNFIEGNNIPNLLFYGPPGTGKTSTIQAIAKDFYGSDCANMVLQLNGSDDRGVDRIREEVKSFATTGIFNQKKKNQLKLVILDQAEMMTNTAQFALRRIIEKCNKTTRFCLITNYFSKIIPALQSRCTRFKFNPLSYDQASNKLAVICQNQGLEAAEPQLRVVFEICQGDFRRVLNFLQSWSLARKGEKMNLAAIYSMNDYPTPQKIKEIMDILHGATLEEGFDRLSQIKREEGLTVQTIINEVYERVFLTKMIPERMCYIVQRLGQLQYRLSLGASQELTLASLISCFHQVKPKCD